MVPLPNENKPYDKITTFSSKEKNRDLRIAPYYSIKIRSPEFCLRHCFLYPGAVCIMKSPYGAVRNLSANCYDLVPVAN